MYYAYVYIMTNKDNNVLYTGVSSNLEQRVRQHRTGVFGGFTSKYNVHKLVYAEPYQDIRDAIAREKQIKGMSRARKIALISGTNPTWRELMPQDEP